MIIDRYFFLKHAFAFSGGDPGRCDSLPTDPHVSAETEPACCMAPSYSSNHTAGIEEDAVNPPATRDSDPGR